MKQVKFPIIKKDFKDFLTEEEGGINKKDLKKITLAILAIGIAVSGLGIGDSAQAGCAHGSHSSHSNHSSGCGGCGY
jgi:hypothetical protein